MRRLHLKAIALLGVVALVIAACGSSTPASNAPVTGSAPTVTAVPTQSQAVGAGPTAAATEASAAAAGGGVATAISVGAGFACAILSDGTVGCWGDNNYGQLGDGTTTASSIPVHAVGISSAKAIATSNDDAMRACAVLSDGTVRCWGYNSDGELGNGSVVNSALPLQVSGITSAIGVAVGWRSTCALLSDGTVQCWGENYSGQLGNGAFGHGATNIAKNPVPAAVLGVNGAIAIAAGGAASDQAFNCALLADGTVQCWGYLAFVGDPYAPLGKPWKANGVSGATAMAAGFRHVCVLVTDGGMQCWGYRGSGGGATSELQPVPGLTDAVAIAAGNSTNCVVRAGGDVVCWGFAPVVNFERVLGVAGAVKVSTGGQTCALLSDGGVTCWSGNGAPVAIANLVPAGPVGTPVPSLAKLTIEWDGSTCKFDTSDVTSQGDVRLVLDSKTTVMGTLLSVGEGHSLADVNQFFATYTGNGAPMPPWLVRKAEVAGNDPFHSNEALVDLTPGSYAALCFDSGLAGYVLAGEVLVVH